MTVGDNSRTCGCFSGHPWQMARDDSSTRQIASSDRSSDHDHSENELLMVEFAAGHAVETEVLRQGLVAAREEVDRLAGELARSARQRTRLSHDRVIAEARLTAVDATLAETRERLTLVEHKLDITRSAHISELQDVIARADRAQAAHAAQLATVQSRADDEIAEVRENCRLAITSAGRTEAQAQARATEAEERLETFLNEIGLAQARAREATTPADRSCLDGPD